MAMSERSMLREIPSISPFDDYWAWRREAEGESYSPFCGLNETLTHLSDMANAELESPWFTYAELPQPQVSHMVNPAVGQLVYQHPWGVVEMARGVTEAEIIVDVCNGFPGARVLVMAPYIAPLQRLCRRIRNTSPDIVSIDVAAGYDSAERRNLDSDDEWRIMSARTRLVFCSYENATILHETEGTPHCQFDIALCLRPELIAGFDNTGFLSAVDIRFRHFGLVAFDQRRSPAERHQLVNVFGFRRVRIPSSGYSRTAVSLVPIRGRHGIRNVKSATTAIDVLRRLQSSRERNSSITELARQLVAIELESMPRAIGQWLSLDHFREELPAILLVAGDPRQRSELAEMLPSWPVHDAVNGAWANAPGDSVRMAICTRDDLRQLPVEFNPKLIVNAAGGPQAIVLPERWLQHHANSSFLSRRLVIDFADRGTEQVHHWSDQRFAQYAENDVFEFNADLADDVQFDFAVRDQFIRETFRPVT